MKRTIVVLVLLAFTVIPIHAQDEGVMRVESFKDNPSVITYAEWNLIANAHAAYAAFDIYWQRPNDDGTSLFKVESDEELAGLKAALEGVNITFDKETNVALTTRQKELLNGVNIKTRSQVNVTLERLEMLDAATTFTEWKEGSLNAEAIQ